MERKEHWIENSLQSLEGIQQAKMSSTLYRNILERAGQGGKVISINQTTVWRAAAAIALLLALNVFSLSRLNDKGANKAEASANTFAQEYFSTGNELNF